jgi:hypothetical protein
MRPSASLRAPATDRTSRPPAHVPAIRVDPITPGHRKISCRGPNIFCYEPGDEMEPETSGRHAQIAIAYQPLAVGGQDAPGSPFKS